MSTYWIYESYPHNKAVVHKGDCLYCGNGTNRQGTSAKRDGFWLGPYRTYDEARSMAVNTKRKRQISCSHCVNQTLAA